MSRVPPDEPSFPVRPKRSIVNGCGRGPLCEGEHGAGGVASRCEVYGNEDAGDELVEAEEEAAPVSSLPSPDMPTQSERDDHDLTHYPYRSWCRHCVEGRGVEMRHRGTDD